MAEDDGIGPMPSTEDEIRPMPGGQEDEIGPMPSKEEDGEEDDQPRLGKRRRRRLSHATERLARLPTEERYERSFMHRDVLHHCLVSRTAGGFLLTASRDGMVKFWKKKDRLVEFVKEYRAHLAPLDALVGSADGALAVSLCARERNCKVFDIATFDMTNIIKLDFTPLAVAWIHGSGSAQATLAVSDADSSAIRILDGRTGNVLETMRDLHRAPVHILAPNPARKSVISADCSGMLEYWSTEDYTTPKGKGMFEFKMQTDLFELKKHRAVPLDISVNPQGTQFAVISVPDRQVRIFSYKSGRMIRKYDESIQAATEMHQSGARLYDMDHMDFARRLATEREIAASAESGVLDAVKENSVWDESGHFLLYPTILGIKVVNTVENTVPRILGRDETHRWLTLAIFQGFAGGSARKMVNTVAMAASDNPILRAVKEEDPTIFATAYRKSRFYLLTSRSPDAEPNVDRDIFNEKPLREEKSVVELKVRKELKSEVILHTSMGDIHLRLFPDLAPKSVENFVTLCTRSYYDGLIFHRVIKKFMLQTGDPLGDGTGGESIWHREFEDEIVLAESPGAGVVGATFREPYRLAMANAGPNTNGSQFFLTTVPCPWLQGKHTIFGKVVKGFEVCHEIEEVRVDKSDKPEMDIQIVSVSVR